MPSKKPLRKITLKKRIEELDLPSPEKLKSVAVKYDINKDKAPKILAIGRGRVAQMILELAEEHKVPLVEDDTLVQLLSKLEINTEIPPQLYTVIAEILAYVYQLDKLAKKRKAIQKRFRQQRK